MPYERIPHKIASRLLTVHPRLLVALVALVGFVALQGSAAAVETATCGGDGVDLIADITDVFVERSDLCKEEEAVGDPGP